MRRDHEVELPEQADADRKLRTEKVKLTQAIAQARAAAALASRMQGFTISHGCCVNPCG